MTMCSRCNGQGLTGGNPDAPHVQVGQLKTCSACKGTGQEAVATPTEEAGASDDEDEPAADPVDNPPVQPNPKKGILVSIRSIFKKK